MTWTRQIVIGAAFVLSAGASGGCRGADPAPAEEPASATAPAPIVVTADGRGLLFRYVSPESGAPATALSAADVPEDARAEVVVFDPARPTPAGWEHVADLRPGLPITTTPTADYRLPVLVELDDPAPTPVGPAPTARRSGAVARVDLFTTQGCPYCDKARRFLQARRIPYSEHDLARDPNAGDRLATLGREAGVSQDQLRGVPVVFVDEQVMVGWDAGRMERMLGGR